MITSSNDALSRRALLSTAGSLALGASLLTACRPGADESPSGDRSPGADGEGATLPIHTPFRGVEPDIPAPHPNALDGFLTFPADPVSILNRKADFAEPVTILGQQSIFVPPPMDKNAFWQNLNDTFGVTLDLTIAPSSDYVSKFQTTIASGELPNLIRVPQVPKLADLAEARFADLTELLAGEAVNDYPMLANIPTLSWNGASFGGRIMGVPMPLLPLATRLEARTDILDDLGMELNFGNAEEFLDFCRAVTDPAAQRWAMVSPYPSRFTRQMCGVPNTWAVADGAFTHEIETDEYQLWLELMATMMSEELIHPQALGNPQVAVLFQAGQFVLFEVGGAGFTSAMQVYVKAAPGLTVAPVIPPRYDGGGNASVYVGAGHNSFTAIDKSLPTEMITELLTLLNGLAAPFGTREWLAVQYGKAGVDYNLTDGAPVLTEVGTKEKIIMNYVPGAPMVMYSPGYPDVTRAECAYEAAVAADALPLPTSGLYSDTDSSTGATLNRNVMAASLDVIAGRKSVADWGSVVTQWRNGGGDTIRAEYEEEYSRLHG